MGRSGQILWISFASPSLPARLTRRRDTGHSCSISSGAGRSAGRCEMEHADAVKKKSRRMDGRPAASTS